MSRSGLALRVVAALCACLLVGLAAACRHLSGAPRALPECPGVLVPTQEIEGAFALRERMRITAGDSDVRLELAIQKRAGELVLVAFDPFGAKLFSVRQRGIATELESLPRSLLPVSPLNVLRDVHRVRFLAAAPPPGGSGIAVAQRDGTEITESWRSGTRIWRRFERTRADPAGTVSVEFPPAAPADAEPPAVRIRNGWCGYEASLMTLSEELLP